METGLVRYDTARRALQEAHTIDEVKDIRDKAEAMRLYAQQAKDNEMAAWAAEIKLRAERKSGELIQVMQANGELAKAQNVKSQGAITKLADHGISASESSRWQQEAAVPDEKFEAYVEECKAKGDIPTASGVRRLAQADRREEKLEEISGGNVDLDTRTQYPIIYADPPWRYEHPPMGGGNRSIENQYPTMTLDEICALPVADLATDDALLYLWATAPKLAECMEVVTAWGFTYRTCLVWVKDKIGMGYHARNRHELLLVGKRGDIPPPTPETRPDSVIEAPRAAHSAKPECVYEIIERCYPTVPKVELFCRLPREGWAVWGNQSGA